jgi:hypothetical protein
LKDLITIGGEFKMIESTGLIAGTDYTRGDARASGEKELGVSKSIKIK